MVSIRTTLPLCNFPAQCEPGVIDLHLIFCRFSATTEQPPRNVPARKRKQSMFRNVQREMGKNNGIAGHLGILRSFAANLTPFVDRLLCY